jgi:DNA helicase-2/ATP-dependent DNA helicase PcrA
MMESAPDTRLQELEALGAGELEPVADTDRLLAEYARADGPSLPEISEELDEHQQAVVTHTGQTIRVLAPAGSGKTHVMVNRILRHRRANVPANRILLLTFDNASRGELQKRLDDLGGIGVHAQTLNAFGNRLLGNLWTEGERLGLAKPAEQRRHCKQALKALKGRSQVVAAVLPDSLQEGVFLDLFSLFKNQIYSVREPWLSRETGVRRLVDVLSPVLPALNTKLLGAAEGDRARLEQLLIALRMLYEEYENNMRHALQMDFDDQKLLPFERLRDDVAIRERVQAAYSEVIVDEFQDLNLLDFELIRLVAAKSSLVVVGDDDQAIYEFRGASPRFILQFDELTAREASSQVLHVNYRSPANLVHHATSLIRHNTSRVEKLPVAAETERTCSLRVQVFPDSYTEATGIAKWIHGTATRAAENGMAGAGWRHYAVLYRMNRQSIGLQVALAQQGIPYRCVREDSMLDMPYFPATLAIMRWWVADKGAGAMDEADVRKLLSTFPRWLEPDDKARLRDVLRPTPVVLARDFSEVLERMPEPLVRRLELNRLRGVLELVREAGETNEILSLLRQHWNGLRETFASVQELIEEWSPYDELIAMGDHVRQPKDFERLLGKALAEARRASAAEGEARDAVVLSTFFRAKGRQFRTVVLPSLVEGWVPHGMGSIEAERRLFYVAVTRATHDLFLSYPEHVMRRATRPSPFLDELDLPDGLWTGRRHASE